MNRCKVIGIFLLVVLTTFGCRCLRRSDTAKSRYKITTIDQRDTSVTLVCEVHRKGYNNWPTDGVVFYITGDNDFRTVGSTNDSGIMKLKLLPGTYSAHVAFGQVNMVIRKMSILIGKTTLVKCEIPYGVEIQYE